MSCVGQKPRNTTGCFQCDSIGLPLEPSWSRGVYHLYVIRTIDRDGMMKHLKEAGIGTGIHYPVPLHLQKAYLSLNYGAGDFPVTESAAAEIVSLPMYPQLEFEQQEKVAAAVIGFTAQMRRESAAAEFRNLVPAEPIA